MAARLKISAVMIRRVMGILRFIVVLLLRVVGYFEDLRRARTW
jgi:hypothetical protein